MNLRLIALGEAITLHISAQFFLGNPQIMLYINY